jgi:hypothetical protein
VLARSDSIRFWKKVNKKKPDECWLWTATTIKDGYGHFRLGEKLILAHRISFKIANPSVDISNLVIDHLCGVTGCVNPVHLEAITQLENLRRYNSPNNHCRRGHLLEGDNIYEQWNNQRGKFKRQCKACRQLSRDRTK